MPKNLEHILPLLKGKVLHNEPMSKHTWLGVGGPAEIMFSPLDLDDLKTFLQNKPQNLPLHILGGGSNLLVCDTGIEGVVLKFDAPYFKQILKNNDTITCFAGLPNALLKNFLVLNELGGLEFLCSIPGTIGGAVKTNAGCFGKSLSDVLISATIIDFDGSIQEVSNADFCFAYRHASVPSDWIIVSLTLKTTTSDKTTIQNILNEQQAYRNEHQPQGVKTAGSTFKNPEGKAAWKLIKEANADVLSVGGAKMSEKHCNFMINTGHATAQDCEQLGDSIIKRVKEKTGITLEWEIQKMGQQK